MCESQSGACSKKQANVSGMIKNYLIYNIMYCLSSRHFFQNQAEKFRYASKLTNALAFLASECTGSVFTSRFDLLKQIVSAWENGKECDIQNDGGK